MAYTSSYSGAEVDGVIGLFNNKGLGSVTGLVKRNADGSFVAGSAGSGTVTSVASGDGLTGGPVTSTGTIKANLKSYTKLTANSSAATETAGRIYPTVLDKSGYLAVVVPWTDNNTTYSAGTGLILTGGEFSVKLGYTTSGNNRAVTSDSNGNLYVVQKDNNTTYSLTQDATDGHKITLTPSSGTAQTITIPDNDTTYTFTDNNPTLSWGTKSKVATVGGTDIHVTMPSNPNTNTTYSLSQDPNDGHKITLTPSSGTAQTITIPDNNTTYSAGTGLSLSGGAFSVKTGYTTSGNNRAVQTDSSGNLYVVQKDSNTWTAMVGATSSADGSVGYVNATPPKDGYNTKYLRADGTWSVPPNTTYSTTGSATPSMTTTATKTTLGTAFTVPNVTSAGSASTWAFEEVSIPNVTAAGSASSWTFEEKSIPNVTAVGSGSASLTASVSSHVLSFSLSHTHTAPTLGTAIKVQSKSGGGNGSAPTLGTAIKVQSKKSGGNGSAPTLGTAFTIPNVTGNTTGSVSGGAHTHSIG